MTSNPSALHETEVDVVQYLAVLGRFRGLIIAITGLAMLTSAVLSFTLPKIFPAAASVLSPKETVPSGLLGGLSGLTGLTASATPVTSGWMPSVSPNRDLFVGLLKSRTVAQDVVERFGLKERWRLKYIEEALQELQERKTTLTVSDEGVIAVTFEDTDPRFAADVANYYVTLLDRLVAEYGSGEAGRQRRFVADQLERSRRSLLVAEDALRTFQERTRAPALPEQMRGAIEASAQLQAAIIAGEVQLEAMRQFATEANPDVQALRRRIAEMRRQLSQMEYGDRQGGSRAADFMVPFANVPAVGLELVRLTREVRVQETVVLLLVQQLEQAKIAEARDLPTVQILDRAVPAERPTKPSLVINVPLAATSIFVAVALAFVMDGMRRRRGAAATAPAAAEAPPEAAR